jgi:hypothetical protein
MATVEELRGKVFRIVDYSWQHTGLEETLNSLIAAAGARGAEQERERIRSESVILTIGHEYSVDHEYCRRAYGVSLSKGEVEKFGKYVVLPASLLSPAPKEKK